jgi:hypothetical protein
MTGLIAKCPVTGDDVFPDFGTLRGEPPYMIVCPACGSRHRWTPLAGQLVEIDDKDRTGSNDGQSFRDAGAT